MINAKKKVRQGDEREAVVVRRGLCRTGWSGQASLRRVPEMRWEHTGQPCGLEADAALGEVAEGGIKFGFD